jgi:hypothetical protein
LSWTRFQRPAQTDLTVAVARQRSIALDSDDETTLVLATESIGVPSDDWNSEDLAIPSDLPMQNNMTVAQNIGASPLKSIHQPRLPAHANALSVIT